jgi:hypothetical protein
MKMLPRKRPAVEPSFRKISSSVPRDGSAVTRTVQITVEHEVLSVLLHPAGVSFTGRCAECGREVLLLTPEKAAQSARVTARAIYRWVEGAAVHFQETATGAVLICSESLASLVEREIRAHEGGER